MYALILCLVSVLWVESTEQKLLERVRASYDASLLQTMAATSRGDPLPAPGNEFVFDNPTVPSEELPLIPSVAKCEVRPESVFEINRLRVSAQNIKQAIGAEIGNMAVRKEFVVKMTNYINDRIMELNSVKRAIKQEEEWLAASKGKIMYLHATEKMIKTEDIMTCLQRLDAYKGQMEIPVAEAVKKLEEQKEELKKEVEEWETKIKAVGEAAAK